jgi:hypothetical protein
MGLIKKWDIERTWGSHQALLKSVLKVLKPEYNVECGCGDYSTPYLIEVSKFLTTIEHDPGWATKIQSQHSPIPKHQWLVKRFRAKNQTRIDELPSGEFRRIMEWYKFLGTGLNEFDFLFVDTFTACRVPAVLGLGHLAKYIMIHDLEPPGPEVYEWKRLDGFLKDWKKYIHKPLGQVGNGHQIPWTGLYSRTPLPRGQLSNAMRDESKRLWNDFTPLEEIK